MMALEWNWNMCAITAVLQIAICNKIKKCIKIISFGFAFLRHQKQEL